MSLGPAATREIRRLHLGFERWFHGDESCEFGEIERSLAADFTFFAPNGEVVERTELLDGIRAAFGSRPIRIRIEAATVLWESDDAVLMAYEEWHGHDDRSTARRSTALLTPDPGAPEGLVWRHVQETAIPRPPGPG
jgi:hypothetical protein